MPSPPLGQAARIALAAASAVVPRLLAATSRARTPRAAWRDEDDDEDEMQTTELENARLRLELDESRETNRRLNRRVGELEREVARRDRAVKRAVDVCAMALHRHRDDRERQTKTRVFLGRLRQSVLARIRFVFTGGQR